MRNTAHFSNRSIGQIYVCIGNLKQMSNIGDLQDLLKKRAKLGYYTWLFHLVTLAPAFKVSYIFKIFRTQSCVMVELLV